MSWQFYEQLGINTATVLQFKEN